jgi:SAM-dependent methyltransferase
VPVDMTVTRGHPVFSWVYARTGPMCDRRGTAERRRQLLANATGRVVEVGAGTGLNFPHYPSEVTDVRAIEPDPYMFRRLVAAMNTASVPVKVRRAPVESMSIDIGSADTVVMSLVLCSVADMGVALAEARRALKHGGRLLFFEHVRAEEPRLARWQGRLGRPWGLIAGGCHPDRDTLAAIEAQGFQVQDVERFDEPGGMLAKPHIIGWAKKP